MEISKFDSKIMFGCYGVNGIVREFGNWLNLISINCVIPALSDE